MLLLSLLVTALTQIAVEAFRLRSSHLERGVAEMLQQMGWSRMTAEAAQKLARTALQGAAAISREELLDGILQAAGQDASHAQAVHPFVGTDAHLTLEDARHATMRIAAERPELPIAAVRNIALLRGPAAGAASAIFGAFEGAMNRVSARFTASSRLLVCVFAWVVAVSLPLDTFDLFRSFSTSEAARLSAVKMAEGIDPQQISPQAIVTLPQTLGQWRARWNQVNILGVTASALLLSMGAPFWFGLLKDLLRLRGTLITPTSEKQLSTGRPAGGEKGDLDALGGMRE